jgi:hypothetical protein
MKTTQINLVRFSLVAMALACLAPEAKAASTAADRNIFQLQLRSTMTGAGALGGPRGWTTTHYSQRGSALNQNLQMNFRGLAAGQVYHLMASQGTSGELVHLSDFMPNRAGAIMMQYLAGSPHHFTGTNNPGQAWGPNGRWTNHMSWVIVPATGNDWCNWMGGSPGMDSSAGMGGMGGSGGMGGGMMGSGWPAMTNWWSGMGNLWSDMANWCWDYTNMWNARMRSGDLSATWWGSLNRGGSHMMPLPASLDQVPAINGLVLMDQNLQPVLTADLANPNTFTYSARSALTNHGTVPGAMGTLQLSATQRSTHFAMSATGPARSTGYFMAVNDSHITPLATDAYGQVRVRQLPAGVTSMRGISSISILDRNYDPVLSATLPPD